MPDLVILDDRQDSEAAAFFTAERATLMPRPLSGTLPSRASQELALARLTDGNG